MRTLLTLLLLLPLTVQGQAIWRNFFVTNQNPRVTVVAGSNATVQASTVGVDQRIFTVNAIPGAGVDTNALNGWLSTNVAGFAGYATNAGSAANSTNFWGVLAPTNLPAGLANSNYVGTFTGNGAGITNLSQGSYTGTLTNAINSTNATLTGPLQIHGDANRTNGWYYSSGGVLTSNANGSVNIAGGNITASGTLTGNGSGITNMLYSGLFASQHIPVGVTNSAAETSVFSASIPGNSIGSNGTLRATVMLGARIAAEMTNIVVNFYYGATKVADWAAISSATGNGSAFCIRTVANSGNPMNQVAWAAGSSTVVGATTGANTVSSFNTTTNFTFEIKLKNTGLAQTNWMSFCDIEILGRN